MLSFLGQHFIVQKVLSTAIAIGCLALLHSLLGQDNVSISNHEAKKHFSDEKSSNECRNERDNIEESNQVLLPRNEKKVNLTSGGRGVGAHSELNHLVQSSDEYADALRWTSEYEDTRTRGGRYNNRKGFRLNRESKKACYRAVRTRKSRYVLIPITNNHKYDQSATKTSLSSPPRSFSTTSTCSPPASPCSQFREYHSEVHPFSFDSEKVHSHNDNGITNTPHAFNTSQFKCEYISTDIRSNNFINPSLPESVGNSCKEVTLQKNETAVNNQLASTASLEDWNACMQTSEINSFGAHLTRVSRQDQNRQLQLVARRVCKALLLERKLDFVSRHIQLTAVFDAIKLNRKINVGLRHFQALWRGNQCRTRRSKLSVIEDWLKRKLRHSKRSALYHAVCNHIMKKQIYQSFKSNLVARINAGRRIFEFTHRWQIARRKKIEESKRSNLRMKRQQREKYLRFRFLLFSAMARTNELDQHTLTNELRRWVSRVLAQIDCECRVIPPSDSSYEKANHYFSLKFPPALRSGAQLELRRNNIAKVTNLRLGRRIMEELYRQPQKLNVLRRWSNRVFVYRRHRNAFYCARIRMFAATFLIQVAIKCRFANMLLAAKSRYFHGICNCIELIHLGSRTRAAIILQATWKYTQAFRYWRRYISVCKLRIVLLANLSKKCKEHIRIRGLHYLVNEFQSAWLTSKIPVSHRSKISVVLIQQNLPGWR
uniref:AlNc14C5G704 protein n=1 Tax=Albugo laibachii Nc14 TaxID=890382 RepID=F0W0R9_9STRA|nr:AlNc14C5G704 [Albugo laibachii Nc14]|eukprot:CCA14643.1 AlNc14C5G704 [Albugo laibachii Nc14]